ncbi:MAG: ABC transporter permease [Ignavibacteria bacterium]|nr:ABC transporter permease [Ignavibacteria bacterium]MBP6509502.1 ABC transporter permease [Candidatus Kapabacteria bacterium]MBK6417725.1 ABC transporter permease [Ignavibacteria bacterium]MBK6760755.1 ABC transporter permease [Ignavibacteria bacterium]MBK7031753.1 ABC transporter permease [Ignavibacteria bacterium]
MWRYLVKRVLLFIPTLFIITVISFAVSRLAPGDPAAAKVGQGAEGGVSGRSTLNEKTIELIRQQWHLDKPIWQQYAIWTGGLMCFDMSGVFTPQGTHWSAASFTGKPDFGKSFQDNRPVFDKMVERVPVTLTMNLIAIILAYLIAVPLGIYSATHPGTVADRISTFVLFALYSLPVFWIGTLAITFLANPEFISIFPSSGLRSPSFSVNWSLWKKLADYSWHLALPMIVYVYADFAFISRQMRSSMLEVIRQDYVRTARAKGLGERAVVYRHALRNALIPLITLVAALIPNLIGGSVIIESIFSIPGMGELSFRGLVARDYPMIMAVFTVSAVLTLAGMLVADILYSFADPRISYGKKAA